MGHRKGPPRPFDVRWTAELEAECSDLRVMGIKRSPSDEERYHELQAERGRWKARQRARRVRNAVVVERDRPPLPALAPVPPPDELEDDDQNPAEGSESAVDADSREDGHDAGEVEERAPFPSPASTSSTSDAPPPPAPEVIDQRRAELRDDLVDALEEWANELEPKPPRFLRRWTGKSLAAVAQKTGLLEHDVPIALAIILSTVGVAAFGVCTFISLRRYVDERRRGPVIVDEQREAA